MSIGATELPFSFEVKDGVIGLMNDAGFLDRYKHKDHDVFYVNWYLATNIVETKLYINDIQVKKLKALTVSWKVNTITVSGVVLHVNTAEETLKNTIEALNREVQRLTLELYNERTLHKSSPNPSNPYVYPGLFLKK